MGTLNLGNGANFVGGANGFLADSPKGTIIQYVQAAHTSMTQRLQTNSSSYTQSQYVITITPKNITSRILILANLSCHADSNGYIYVRGYNDTASRYLTQDEDGVSRNSGMYESAIGGRTQWGMMPYEGVDFPNSTSAQTYRLYIRSSGSGTIVYTGWSGSAPNTYNMNYMHALEIAQ